MAITLLVSQAPFFNVILLNPSTGISFVGHFAKVSNLLKGDDDSKLCWDNTSRHRCCFEHYNYPAFRQKVKYQNIKSLADMN